MNLAKVINKIVEFLNTTDEERIHELYVDINCMIDDNYLFSYDDKCVKVYDFNRCEYVLVIKRV